MCGVTEAVWVGCFGMWLIVPVPEEAGIPSGRKMCVTEGRRPDVNGACGTEIRNTVCCVPQNSLCRGLRSPGF